MSIKSDNNEHLVFQRFTAGRFGGTFMAVRSNGRIGMGDYRSTGGSASDPPTAFSVKGASTLSRPPSLTRRTLSTRLRHSRWRQQTRDFCHRWWQPAEEFNCHAGHGLILFDTDEDSLQVRNSSEWVVCSLTSQDLQLLSHNQTLRYQASTSVWTPVTEADPKAAVSATGRTPAVQRLNESGYVWGDQTLRFRPRATLALLNLLSLELTQVISKPFASVLW